MLRNPKYRRQIILPPVIAAIILTIAMSWVFLSANQLIKSAQHKIKISDTKYEAVKLHNSVVASENSLRGYLLTGNIEFLQNYKESTIENASLILQLNKHKADIPQIATPLISLDKHIKKLNDTGQATFQIQLSAGSYAPHLKETTNDRKFNMDQIRNQIIAIEDILASESNKIDYHLATTLNRLKILSFAIVLIMTTILLLNYRRTIWLFENSTSIKELAEKLGHLAMHDALTKLPNRRNFEQYLKQTISQANRSKQRVGLLYMDLDGFKLINDQYGHDAGDRALIAAVERIGLTLRDSDFFARVGGDEFVLVVNHFHDNNELQNVSNRIIQSLHESIIDYKSGNQFSMGVSIGVAVYPDNVKSSKDLIIAADKSMYRAKKSGKNQAVFYNTEFTT